MNQFEKVKSFGNQKSGCVQISGVSEGRGMPFAAAIASERKSQCLIITTSFIKAKSLAKDLSFFSSEKIFVLPEEEQLFVSYEAKSHGELNQRLAAEKALLSNERCIVIAPGTAAVKKIPPRKTLEQFVLTFCVGETIDIEDIKVKFVNMGYERASYVETKGQYSIRGGIIDLFAADSENPVRIELFDDEVDSIRIFDADTQRSLENINKIEVYPAEQMVKDTQVFEKALEKIEKAYDSYGKKQKDERKEKILLRKEQLLDYVRHSTNMQLLENYIHYFYEDYMHIWNYMKADGIVMVDDPDRVWDSLSLREKELKEDFKALLEKGQVIPDDFLICTAADDLKKAYENRLVFLFSPFPKQLKGVDKLLGNLQISSKQTPVFNGKMEFLETDLKRYAKSGYDISILCATDDRVENMQSFIAHCGLTGRVKLVKGSISGGIEYPDEKIVYIWDGDIFTTQKQRKTRFESKNAKPIKVFTDIKKGDYVVHESHGIGKFIGIEQLVIQKVKKDYLKIKYAGEDMLYIPVDQMDIIQKFIGADGKMPKVSKLSSGEWKKTKAKAKAAIDNMAKELIELSASRQLAPGFAFSEDMPWQKEFEELFPFEETHDQLRCIMEIKADMEKPVCMDRLLCGDVGYGKTEVAARAIFKCVAEGKQAAILVPTTVLANQHYYSFKSRFEEFPFTVEMLSRFRNEKQQEAIIDKARMGSIDILIGTHRILSKDVKFKNLGLLVVDEEQRFGVHHKEVIKMIKKNVDVLTLSATPIPRTLHMSLVGIKEMSLIEEPPEERQPVQTYVMEEDEELMGEAITRELDRGGQVFVVYNRVRGISRVAAQISQLVPEGRVGVVHGQMNEKIIEDVMVGFVNQEYNVLVATTIIESGLDISNANTMIILDADKYGLSQLYQLRGRVGRSNRMAYAYLMYQKDKVLTEVAEKRLRAIKEFTEFGAGFRIAMRDLEIRGAGNLLGTEQHGNMMTIGYELYCKLISEAVKTLQGEAVSVKGEEASIEIDEPAYISEKFIPDEILKLQIYKKIASIETKQDKEDLIDEIIDRFGEIPKETLNLINISQIRAYAETVGITRIYSSGNKLIYDFSQNNFLKPEALADLVEVYGMKVLIHGGVKPNIKCIRVLKNKLADILRFLEILVV